MGEVTDADVFQRVEIIPNRVYFCPSQTRPETTPEVFYFTCDEDPFFEYHPFFKEFGPPSIHQIHHFYKIVCRMLGQWDEKIEFFCYDNAFKFTTSVCLTGFPCKIGNDKK